MLLFLFWLVWCIYVGLMLIFFKGWRKSIHHDDTESGRVDSESIHLIIPFRNEAEQIPQLLERLLEFQEDEGLALNPVFVDDHSDDSSVDMVEHAIGQGLRATLHQSAGFGKKAALMEGRMGLSPGYHVTMDADVVPHRSWKQELHVPLSLSMDMVILPVLPKKPVNSLSKVSALETMSLLGVTMATASLGRATMANGANLMIRNNLGLDDRPEIPSGDDVFLLHDLKRQGGRIGAIPRLQNAVYTATPRRWAEWFDQRKRWAAKSMEYKDRDTLILGWSMLLVNGGILVLLMSIFFTRAWLWMFITLLSTKFVLDFLFLHSICKYYRMTSLLSSYPLAALMNPLQYLAVFIGSRLGGYTWKGRRHSQ